MDIDDDIKRAIFQRKRIRFLFCGVYLGLIAAIVALCCKFAMKHDRILLDASKALNFKIDNCTLTISDHVNSQVNSNMYAEYELPRNLSRSKIKYVSVQNTQDAHKISIDSNYDIEYCSLNLFIKPGVVLKSISINCEDCNVIQDTSFQLEILGELVLSGNNAHANFRNVKAERIYFDASIGHFQLNNIETTGSTKSEPSSIILIEGDVIVQSVSDLKVYTAGASKAYCFSGSSITQVQTNTCTAPEEGIDLFLLI